MQPRPLRYGLIGAGGFGRHCVRQYQQMDTVQPVAVADQRPAAAGNAAADLNLEACPSVDAMLARDDIDLVHLATPPAAHAALATAALAAGKHVLCEKPLAITVDDAETMIATAARHNRVLGVNLIMRYNPLAEAVRHIIHTRLLGEPLYGRFENAAQDQSLGPDHWFWDRAISGGIFIEHGVHFFDLFEWWLGDPARPTRVLSAQQVARPGAQVNGGPLIDQVQAQVCYRDSIPVNFYHGFTQPARMDRQAIRLLFERGDLRLREWVPTSIRIDCLADTTTIEALQHILPAATVRRTEALSGDQRRVLGRHKHFEADGRYAIESGAGMDKPAMYGHVLRALLEDQLATVRDPTHRRRVSEANGLRSLTIAAEADRLARSG